MMDNQQRRQQKETLLEEWKGYLFKAASESTLTGKPCYISRFIGIAGPRAGALEMHAGIDSKTLLQTLRQHDAATLRQFVPWQFNGEPNCYMAGRYVRVEAGWPDWLAEKMVRLSDLSPHPKDGGRWVAGKNELGQTGIAMLDDRTPHYLISGATGSGKSVALRNALLQLSRDPSNQLVLIDGKYGKSLNPLSRLPGVIGPVAVEGPAVRAALGWTCQEMRRRYENGHDGRVVIIFDEIQEFVNDSIVVALMKRIAAQGRDAGVHLLASTQHPTVDAFGDPTVRRNLTGKLALMVADADASRVAVGGRLPRADFLLGAGDCYTVTPGICHRVQGAYVDERDFDGAESGEWEFDTWPEYDAVGVGQELPRRGGNSAKSLQPGELGAALVSAMEKEGRPTFQGRVESAGLSKPGSDRARSLLQLGRQTLGWLENNGVGLFYLDDGEWKVSD